MILEPNVKALKRQKQFGRARSIKAEIKNSNAYGNSKENSDLLYACQNDWDRLATLRGERARNIRYKNGDQWGDMVTDPKTGKLMREDVYLSQQSKTPLKRNFIQQFVRNIHGQLLTNKSQTIVNARTKDDSELSEMLTNTINAAHKLNKIEILNLSVLEDLLMSGISCTKVRYSFFSEKNRDDVKVNLVNIGRLFFNSDVEDPRMTDLRRIGEIHDYTIEELVGNFAQSRDDEKQLREIYSSVLSDSDAVQNKDMTKEKSPNSFLVSDSSNKCRVIEVWEKLGRWVTYVHDYMDGTEQVTSLSMAQVEELNRSRVTEGVAAGLDEKEIALLYAQPKFEHYWRASYLTPYGECIKRFESPFAHESHPYVITTMPMVDGSIKSVIGDLIDVQRNINRLMVLKDAMLTNSAKGVKFVSEDIIPDTMTTDEFIEQWNSPDGVVIYKGSASPHKTPQQIGMNNTDNGTTAMLQLEMQFIQQLAGLSGAIQGESSKSGTPSSLYAQQAMNSQLNYRVVFEVFNYHSESRDDKLLKVIMQFYSDKRYVDIAGDAYKETAKVYDPKMVEMVVDYNLVVTNSLNTPVYRQMADDMMYQMLQQGFIDTEMFLENSSLPFAESLKEQIKQKKEAMAEQQAAAQPPQMMGAGAGAAAGGAEMVAK